MMAGGPNSRQKPSFFSEWSVLEAELKTYLEEREKGEPEEQAQPTRNPVLNFLSVDPSTMGIKEEEEEWEGELDILSYSELTRYGYGYLVNPLMNQGGYLQASARMGIPLKKRVLKDREYYREMTPKLALRKNDEETGGFLALGSSLEKRIDSITEVSTDRRRKDLFNKQATMGKAKATQGVSLSKPPEEPSAGRGGAFSLSLTDPPGSRSDSPLVSPSPSRAMEVEPGTQRQPLMLSLPQRLYAVVVAASSALAFGHGTERALELGLLPQGTVESTTYVSLFLLGLNATSAAAGGVLAKGLGRSQSLWFFKGVLAGVLSVLELRGLGPLGAAAGAEEESIAKVPPP
ncbi:unnamed protein product [Discosporangium mesarthrocarpum]